MKDKELKEFIDKGHIHIRVIFEMAGNPKEHVEETMKRYIETIKQDPEYIFMKEYMAPTEEKTDKIWSTFLEADVLVSGFDKLSELCFNMGPASIEIIQPEAFSLTEKNMTNIYNDIISKLHEISMVNKALSSESEMLKLNLNRSIRNCVILALSEPKSADEMATKVGIDKEHLQPFLEAMVREKSIVLDNNRYIMNK